jgi:hypothetical protein
MKLVIECYIILMTIAVMFTIGLLIGDKIDVGQDSFCSYFSGVVCNFLY